MSRWAPAIALLAALSPLQVLPAAPSTTVRVVKASSPFRSGTTAARWTPRLPPAPMALPLGRVPLVEPPAGAADPAASPEVVALARARACKVFDRNANGVPDGGEPLVEGWKFRLTGGAQPSRVRTTGWDGCADFEGLLPGSYLLTDVLPPLWDPGAATVTEIEVPAPGEGPARSPRSFVSSRCVEYANLGNDDFWTGHGGLRLLDDEDRRFVNSLPPFQSPSSAFASGDEPFDGRLSDGVTPVKGTRHADAGAWGAGTWEAELTRFLEDRKVAADPRGRLAQEILLFALNRRHFLEGAQVVYLEEQPLFVDDLLFEGILAWLGESPAWNHEMTALLAAFNGVKGLPFVPSYPCQVAYLPF